MKTFIRNNGLSIAFLILFLWSTAMQVHFGMQEFNTELSENGAANVDLAEYLQSGHFFQSTFENWESEFLQMGLLVWMTIFLRQKGSSESKSLDKKDPVDREPDPKKKDTPWPVKKGGIVLMVYEHSLTLVLFLIFIVSFLLHFYGSLRAENLELALQGKPHETVVNYLGSSRFWFESFQNWQSEFLSVFAIIFLSIYLRQKGSSQSKPVDAPHDETGE